MWPLRKSTRAPVLEAHDDNRPKHAYNNYINQTNNRQPYAFTFIKY